VTSQPGKTKLGRFRKQGYHKSSAAVDRLGPRPVQTIEAVAVRYCITGEDENYERELERVGRLGVVPPAPMSPFDVAGVIHLVGTQAAVHVRHCGLRAVVALSISRPNY
jgi:hypothetical protein